MVLLKKIAKTILELTFVHGTKSLWSCHVLMNDHELIFDEFSSLFNIFICLFSLLLLIQLLG